MTQITARICMHTSLNCMPYLKKKFFMAIKINVMELKLRLSANMILLHDRVSYNGVTEYEPNVPT